MAPIRITRTAAACITVLGLAATTAMAQQRTWRAAVTVAGAARGTTLGTPSLAVDDDGGAIVAWVRGGRRPAVFVAVRPDADAPFGAPRRVSPVCGSKCQIANMSVAMNARGDAAITWVRSEFDSDRSAVWAATRAADGTLGAATAVSGVRRRSAIGSPAVAVDPSGRALVAYDDADGGVRVRSRVAGADWSSAVALGGTAMRGGGSISLSVAPDGRMAVAWPVGRCGGRIARAAADGVWGTPVSPVASGCADGPAVLVDPAGGTRAVWDTWDGLTQHLVAARAADGAGFGSPTTLGTSFVGALEPHVLRALADGGVAVAWMDGAGRAATARTSGDGWAATRAAASSAGVGSVDVGADGTAVFATPALNAEPTWVAVAGPEGPWGALTPATVADSGPGKAAVLPNGDVLLVTATGPTPGRARVPAVRANQYTARALPPLSIRVPRATRLTAPGGTIRGVVANLTVHLDGFAVDAPARVQRQAGARWVDVATGTLNSEAFQGHGVLVPLRLTAPGRQRIRVLVGAATTGPEATFIVTRPVRPRIPLPLGTTSIASGAEGVWLLGPAGPDTDGTATLTRVNPATGAPGAPPVPVELGLDLDSPLAVGAGAVWASDSDGVVRLDAGTGVVRRVAMAGGALGVAAGDRFVWALGVCEPRPVPALEDCHPRRGVRLDPATGEPTDVTLGAMPTGDVDGAAITGDVIWAWGEVPGDQERIVLLRANAATGAVTLRPASYDVFSFAPLGPDALWGEWRSRLGRIRPPGPPPDALLPGFQVVQMVPTGATRAWLLQRRPRGRAGLLDERLVQVNVRTGRRTGRMLRLGLTGDTDTTVTIHRRVAFVLHPNEAALLRVPLPPSR